MKKIVTIIKPFTYMQNLFVYEDGEKINTTSASLDDLPNLLINLVDKYETTDIQLIGNLKFLKGIKKDIEDAEITKYNKNMLNIELISN